MHPWTTDVINIITVIILFININHLYIGVRRISGWVVITYLSVKISDKSAAW